MRTHTGWLRSLAVTLASVVPALTLAGCSAEEEFVDEAVGESAAALGVEVPTCSQAANSGYNNTTQNLAIAMTAGTPAVVLGVVNGYVTINGYACVKPTANGGGKIAPAAVKKITVTGTSANDEKVVLDLLSGSFGSSVMSATGGITIDLVSGTGDAFSLRGTSGADKWTAGENTSNLYFEVTGDTTADVRVSNADSATISTSAGNDTFTARGGTLAATHLAGSTLTTVSAVAVDLTVNGGDGDDTITGGDGDDTISGGNNNDIFKTHTAADGDDTIAGGAGTDKMDFSNRTAALTVVMDGATDSGEGAEADLIGDDVEDLLGGGGDDDLTGNESANNIKGGAGADVISGGPAGTCTADLDVFDGEAGDDTFAQGSDNDCGDTLTGGAGTDRVDYQERSATLTITLDGNGNDGLSGEKDNVKNDIEIVLGGSGDDSITGSSNADTLHGGPGADTLFGGAGNDILSGNSGNDTLNGEAGDDIFDESGTDAEYTVAEEKGDGNDIMNGGTNSGAGLDKVDYTQRTDDLTVTVCMDSGKTTGNSSSTAAQCTDSDGDLTNSEADKIVNITHIVGGDGADTLTGSTAADTIEGGAGNDTLSGGTGDDTLYGDGDDDDLFGDAGDDYLDGVGGTDTLDGDNVSNAGDGDICISESGETITNCEL